MLDIVETRELKYTPEIEAETADLYKKVERVIPAADWEAMAPYIAEINRLKKEKNAVLLAHNYQTPEIFHCVSDYAGDSLQLAQQAERVDAEIIIQAGVHFMAETSKILSPQKTVLIPDLQAGCSLASSITAEQLRAVKAKYPGIPVVTYVNTTAEVKAETDICCTSSNAVQVVEYIAKKWGVDRVIMAPDKYLAANVAKQTDVEIIPYDGACEVHERFTPQDIRDFRSAYPKADIIAHPECPPEVVDECDFSGSTKAMIDYAKNRRPKQIVMVTECSMSDNVAAETPDVEFVRPCSLCPHMKRITLAKILNTLKTGTFEVLVDPAIAVRAKQAVDNMLDVKV